MQKKTKKVSVKMGPSMSKKKATMMKTKKSVAARGSMYR